MNNSIIIHDLGLLEYEDALKYQLKLFDEIISNKIRNRRNKTKVETKNHLVFVEHKNVYTLGKSGNKNNLLIEKNILKEKGVHFFNTNRGGDITYHGPGQLVGYPILDLDCFFTDIHKYLRFLEECVINTLKDFNIVASRSKGETGVWVDAGGREPRKICAIGIRTSRWVTMHGFALNVNTDLSYFDNIIPCGIRDKSVTSMKKECRQPLSLNKVSMVFKKHFESIFNVNLV